MTIRDYQRQVPTPALPRIVFDGMDASDIRGQTKRIQGYYGDDAVVTYQCDGASVNVTVTKYGRIIAVGVY